MDIFTLKRSDTFIKRKCKIVGESLVAAGDIKVICPTTFESGKLLTIDERIYSVCNLMYTDGKEYAVINLAAVIELGKVPHRKIKMMGFDGQEVECYEFTYTKGQKIHPTNKVPVNAQLSYDYVNHHILMGKSIPYYDYNDIDTILDSIPRMCQFGLPEYGYTNHFTEMILRSTKDLQVPSRLVKEKGFTVIPFSSIILNVSSNIGKNRGGYLEDGIQSASVTTAETSTTLEKVLRS